MAQQPPAILGINNDFRVDLPPENADSSVSATSHSSPKHHRTSCLLDSSSSNGSRAANSWNGSISMTGSHNSSLTGGLPIPENGISSMAVELPDFASMLPSECSFSESSADNASAPTPHTPVVLSIFEGECLKAASSRSSEHHPWDHQHQQQQLMDDEFAFHEFVPHDDFPPHEAHMSVDVLQEDGWLPSQFPSLLNRRTLSAVMEGDHEGLDDDEQQQQQQREEVLKQQFLLAAAGNCRSGDHLSSVDDAAAAAAATAFEKTGSERVSSSSSISAVAAAAASELSPVGDRSHDHHVGGVDDALDESGVQLDLSSGSVIIHQDHHHQQQQQTQSGQQQQQQHGGYLDQPQQQPCPEQQQGLAVLAEPLQQQQQQQPSGTAEGLDLQDSLDLPAVELRISSRSVQTDDGKGVVAVGAEQQQQQQQVEDEWEVANKQRLQELLFIPSEQQQQNGQQQQQQPPHSAATLPVGHLQPNSYQAAEAQLLAADMRCHRAAATQSLPSRPNWLATKLQQLFSCGSSSGGGGSSSGGSGVVKGSSDREEVVLLLCLAKTGFNDGSQIHVGILQAVYTAYTGKTGSVPRFGPHWCDIGFQGDDPATDLRGVGMLGLLQLLYLPHHDATAAQQIYKLSTSVSQDFPLAIVGLNITRWTMNALRSGCLRRAAHQLGSYAAAANHFYCGAWYEFYARWCQGKTMRDSGFVLKHLEEYCKKHPVQLLQLAAAADKVMAAASSKAWQPS